MKRFLFLAILFVSLSGTLFAQIPDTLVLFYGNQVLSDGSLVADKFVYTGATYSDTSRPRTGSVFIYSWPHLFKASDGSAGTSPIKFLIGDTLVITENGALEVAGNYIYYTGNDGVRRKLSSAVQDTTPAQTAGGFTVQNNLIRTATAGDDIHFRASAADTVLDRLVNVYGTLWVKGAATFVVKIADSSLAKITTANKVSGNAITDGTIAGTTIFAGTPIATAFLDDTLTNKTITGSSAITITNTVQAKQFNAITNTANEIFQISTDSEGSFTMIGFTVGDWEIRFPGKHGTLLVDADTSYILSKTRASQIYSAIGHSQGISSITGLQDSLTNHYTKLETGVLFISETELPLWSGSSNLTTVGALVAGSINWTSTITTTNTIQAKQYNVLSNSYTELFQLSGSSGASFTMLAITAGDWDITFPGKHGTLLVDADTSYILSKTRASQIYSAIGHGHGISSITGLQDSLTNHYTKLETSQLFISETELPLWAGTSNITTVGALIAGSINWTSTITTTNTIQAKQYNVLSNSYTELFQLSGSSGASFTMLAITAGDWDITFPGKHGTLLVDYDTTLNIASKNYVMTRGFITALTQHGNASHDSAYAAQSWVLARGYLTSVTSHGNEVHTSSYYTEGDVDAKLENFVHESYLATWPGTGYITTVGTLSTGVIPWSLVTGYPAYITSSALVGYATQTWVGNQGYLTSVTAHGNEKHTSSYYTEGDVDEKLENFVSSTALSTWAGTGYITTVGTLSSGTVPWSLISGAPSTYAPSTHGNASHSSTFLVTESDPTIYSWAKAAAKPSYTYSEVGASASGHNHSGVYAPVFSGATGSLEVVLSVDFDNKTVTTGTIYLVNGIWQ